MVRSLRLCAFAALIASTTAAAPATASDAALQDGFDLYLGGLLAAQIDIDAAVGSAGYTVDISFATAGFVKSLYEARIDAASEGRVAGKRLLPGRFFSDSRNSRQNRQIEMVWQGGAPSVRAEPDYDPEPWQIDPAQQSGTFDPLTAVAAAFLPAAAGELCDRNVEVFDGRRRYDVELGEPEAPNASGEIACPATYRRVAGFKPKLIAENPDFPFRVFFAPRPGGHWSLVRAVGDTPIGTFVLRRRG